MRSNSLLSPLFPFLLGASLLSVSLLTGCASYLDVREYTQSTLEFRRNEAGQAQGFVVSTVEGGTQIHVLANDAKVYIPYLTGYRGVITQSSASLDVATYEVIVTADRVKLYGERVNISKALTPGETLRLNPLVNR